MSDKEKFAQLKPESPFYEIFLKGLAPIKRSSGPVVALLGDSRDQQEAYLLDLTRCTPLQIQRLAETIAGEHNASVAEVLEFINKEKTVPIRTSQVSFVIGDAINLRMFI